jgi:Fic family protein
MNSDRQSGLFSCQFGYDHNRLHPFQDGNGKLSRILTSLLLLQSGYACVPYSSLENVIEANKEAYYVALRHTQATIRTRTPDWQPWLEFFLRALESQVHRLSRKIEQERVTIAPLSELAIAILDRARDHGRVTSRDMVRLTGASPNTLKAAFSRLVHKGLLVRRGGSRTTWYALL